MWKEFFQDSESLLRRANLRLKVVYYYVAEDEVKNMEAYDCSLTSRELGHVK